MEYLYEFGMSLTKSSATYEVYSICPISQNRIPHYLHCEPAKAIDVTVFVIEDRRVFLK